MGTLTTDQRNTLVYALGHLIRGMDPDDDRVMLRELFDGLTAEQERKFRERLRIWAGSAVAVPLAALLAEADGRRLPDGEDLALYGEYMDIREDEVQAYLDRVFTLHVREAE